MLGIAFVAATKQQKGGMSQQCLLSHLLEPQDICSPRSFKETLQAEQLLNTSKTLWETQFKDVADCAVFQLLNDPAKLPGMGVVSIYMFQST